MCKYTKNYYVYTSCLDPGAHYFAISYDGTADERCPRAPHERYIVVEGVCLLCNPCQSLRSGLAWTRGGWEIYFGRWSKGYKWGYKISHFTGLVERSECKVLFCSGEIWGFFQMIFLQLLVQLSNFSSALLCAKVARGLEKRNPTL